MSGGRALNNLVRIITRPRANRRARRQASAHLAAQIRALK
jgi:hypothetical protein